MDKNFSVGWRYWPFEQLGPVVFYWWRKFHFGSIKMKIKNRVLHVKERPLQGENPSAEGGGGLAQFTLPFFFCFVFF